MSRVFFGWALVCATLISRSAVAQLASSGTVTVSDAASPLSAPTQDRWSTRGIATSIQVSAESAPDGSTVMQFTAQGDGSLLIQHTLSGSTDLRTVDSFTFFIRSSATRIADYVFLVDSHNRRRWFPLILRSARGWQEPRYYIDAFAGQDAGFDPSSIAIIRFAQAAQRVGDVIWVSPVRFEADAFNHAEAPGAWSIDIGTGTISASADAVEGNHSVLASLTANSWGQADIAVNGPWDRIRWNWSRKSFVSFYYKDAETTASHYFLIYDNGNRYRQWIFKNTSPGKWIKVTADLHDGSYFESGPVDLANIVYFEVGIFRGTPSAHYSFQIDEVTVH